MNIRQCQKVTPRRENIRTERCPGIWVDIATPHGWLRKAFLRRYLNPDLNEKVRNV